MKDISDIGEGHCASEWGGRETGKFLFTDDEVRALIDAEREACANECEQEHKESGEHQEMALHCADRIRARKEPQG